MTLAMTDVILFLLCLTQERDVDLEDEHKRQNENDQLRKQFAQAANAFHSWLTATRYVVFSYVDPKSHVRYCQMEL
jgi:spectrin alpha